MWTLLTLIITGTFSANVQTSTLPFTNKDACVKAATEFANNSTSVGFICISSETGEMLKFGKSK